MALNHRRVSARGSPSPGQNPKSARLLGPGAFRALSLAGVLAAALACGLAAACAATPSRATVAIAREWYELGNAWLSGASFNLARALTESGDYAPALRFLDSLAARDPGNVRVIAARAYALYRKGDAAAALAAYREALALDPYAPDAVYNAALLELAAGDAAAAVADLSRLTFAKGDDGQAFLLLGRANDKAGDTDDSRAAALAAYEKARALEKADPAALERMGALYEKARRYTEAMDALDAAVKADPKRAAAWFSLARLRLVVAEDADKGLAALGSALEAGFADKDAAASLLAEPDLPERGKVQGLLKSKGLSE
jgi:tetratricopeptide (TPR) repeat protein